jgi:hypothetical protein
LSVRPGRSPDIRAHLLPHFSWQRMTIASSAGVHGVGRHSCAWLFCHRSRHSRGSRFGRTDVIEDHRCGPCWQTQSERIRSSSRVHGSRTGLTFEVFLRGCHWQRGDTSIGAIGWRGKSEKPSGRDAHMNNEVWFEIEKVSFCESDLRGHGYVLGGSHADIWKRC